MSTIASHAVPKSHQDLLTRPLLASLATVRTDGCPQVNPMWFVWDGDLVKFSHTSTRRKFRNIQSNPQVSMLIVDPDNTFRFIEIRGRIVDTRADPTGSLYVDLSHRYGNSEAKAPDDSADRVILSMTVEHVVTK